MIGNLLIMNKFIFNYQVIEDKEFEIDIEKLADILINECIEHDVNWLDVEFGDNVQYYLNQLGFTSKLKESSL